MGTTQIEHILKDWTLWPEICSNQPTLEQITPLMDGLTNSNWLLEVKKSQDQEPLQYVIRINATNNMALKLNRQAEWDMHQTTSRYGICPAYLYRDPSDTYWIRPFLKTHTLESTISRGENLINSDFLKMIANHFQTIHSTPISNKWPKIIYSELIHHYWQQITEKQTGFKKRLEETSEKKLNNIREILEKKLQDSNYTPCLCHMDPNPSNWILNNKELHLIDWEYAALGNKAWDLAVFSDTCNLSAEQIELLLNHYQVISSDQFNMAKMQMKYLSILWYYVQDHLTDNELLKQLNALQDNPTKH